VSDRDAYRDAAPDPDGDAAPARNAPGGRGPAGAPDAFPPGLDWLPGPADPAPVGAYGPEAYDGSSGPFAVPGRPGTGAADVLAAWAALLHHHTGRREQEVRLLRPERPESVARLAVDPGVSLGYLVVEAARAIAEADPSDEAPDGLPLLAVGIADPLPDAPLTLVMHGQGGPVGPCVLTLRYDPATVRADSAARHAVHLAEVLAQSAGDAGRSVRTLDPLSGAERVRLVAGWNATARDYPAGERVESVFAAWAAREPGRPAVVHEGTTLSYAELDRRSTRLAARLTRRGLIPGEPVALLLPREPVLVVAALAVLKAGGAYLPIDPGYPGERISYLLRDSRARHLLSTAALTAHFAAVLGDAVTPLLADDQEGDSDTPTAAPRMGADDAHITHPPAGKLADPSADAPAYLMYTSGTTGMPKGVLIPHRGVVRLVRSGGPVPLDSDTRVAQIGATGFDASVWEIWAALLNGGTLHILGRETFLDPAELMRALAGQAVTTMLVTPALFHQLAEADPTVFRPLRDLLVGGDVLSAKHARAVLRANPGLRLVNAYGPTENAVVSTCHLVTEPVPNRVPIGRPVPNTVAYVLNQDRLPLPTGVPGELYVGGEGMARGYHDRPGLTRHAFVEDPFRPGRTLYRTGDRVRRLPDGSLDFVGRTDHQVKVSGFRVEPGEVETVLLTDPAVSAAAVVARRRPDSSDSYLCAYVCGDGSVTPDQVRARVRPLLPPHMVPAQVVVLAELPLTANGKVDRAALPEPPAPARTGTAGDGAPADAVERGLVELWEEVLGAGPVGTDDTLDDLGAGSLSATRLAGRVQQRFGVACPVSAVLAARTVAALAVHIRGAERTRDGGEGPRPGPDTGRTPLSPQQRGVYVEQIKDPSGTQYNLPVTVDLPGTVPADRLRTALAELVARHEVLRTVMAVDGGEPYSRVLETPAGGLEEAVLPPGEDLESWTRRWIRPFDPHRAPLWRAALLRHPTGTRLVLDIHHLLTDGRSLTLLLAEWAALVRGELPAAPALQYRDFARWTAGPEYRQRSLLQGRFWAGTYREPVKPLGLPTDHPRPPLRDTAGGMLEFRFGAERSRAIRRTARAERLTAFHVLLAAYTAFLGRISGSEDVTVGTPVSGRHLPGVDGVQGMFVNTLCLRARPRPDLPFRDHLHAVARHAVDAADHQDHPFGDVVKLAGERDYGRHPLFDTLFAVQDTGLHQVDFLGGSPRWRPEATGRTLFDLNLQVDDAPDGFTAQWSYALALFLRPTVETFRDELLGVLDAALGDPGLPLGALGRVPGVRRAAPAVALDFDF
jgi:amino acid adenylation domain-containing protein